MTMNDRRQLYSLDVMGNLLPAILCALLVGCASYKRALMPAPNLYTGTGAPVLFEDLPDGLKSTNADLFYVTDREPEIDEENKLTYGYGRSRSAAFGSAIVAFKPDMAWEDLERVSVERDRSTRLSLEMMSIEELGRFEDTPGPIVVVNGKAQRSPAYLESNQKAVLGFRNELKRRLALSPRNEIIMFVHGYNNDFNDAAFTLAELWHYMGRQFVPLLYTWPAGRGGPSGYIYDRESGEFTVHHLKNLISELSDIPEVETFHLIAHSRGTDVMTSAFRELTLVGRASQAEVPDEFRGSHIVLAAPDLDMDVVSQRIVAEDLGRETRNITIYTSQSDKAIGLAEKFFKSVSRLGTLGTDELTETVLSSVRNVDGISFIDLQETTSLKATHSYFHSDPAASSDLILTIRYDREPGAENGRPLKPVTTGFWQIEPGYPHVNNVDK